MQLTERIRSNTQCHTQRPPGPAGGKSAICFVSTAKAMKPESTVGFGPDEEVEAVAAEEGEEENLSPVSPHCAT